MPSNPDAGGKGLLLVFEGMISVLRDGVMMEDTQPQDDGKTERR